MVFYSDTQKTVKDINTATITINEHILSRKFY